VKRPQLTPADRFLWAWLAALWRDRRSALVLVKPETVIAWHRKGFRLIWTWKVRPGHRVETGVALILDTDLSQREQPSVVGEALIL
jgi:hypothetical protein